MLYDCLPGWKSKMVLGDFNAKVDQETIYGPIIEKESLHRETNENDNMLIKFA